MPMIRISLALAAVLLSPTPLLAETIVGRASVIDGDTLEIRGIRIRFHGVDAPESAQTCQSSDGKAFRCGQQAALALSSKIGTATVSCEQKDVDRYKRIVAVCSAGGEDLNAWLVQQGHALAYRQYSTDYVGQENDARKAKRGVWAGNFTPPWDWRKGDREGNSDVASGQTAPAKPTTGATECRIKGNINAKGDRIFHVPGSRDYERTKINAGTGKRWFCSESEAIAAGWRAPRG
jgi:endonuclease YncB( thermonuclease family)